MTPLDQRNLNRLALFALVLGIIVGMSFVFLISIDTSTPESQPQAQGVGTVDVPDDWVLVGYLYLAPNKVIQQVWSGMAAPSPTWTPTLTSTPTFTPEVGPTVTPEVGTPIPITPGPTIEPPVSWCYGTVEATTLFIRSGPGTVYGSIGSLTAGQRVFIQFMSRLSNGDEWANVVIPDAVGWAAARYNGNVYIRLDMSEECENAYRAAVPYADAQGWTITTSAPNIWALVAGYFQQAGRVLAVTVAGETGSIRSLLEAGSHVYVNWRPHYDLHLPDCGEKNGVAPVLAAQQRVGALRDYVNFMLSAWGVKDAHPARVIIQIENECWFPNVSYLNQWTTEVARLCTAEGWTCMPFVMATGHPDVAWLPDMQPTIDALLAGGHIYGLNVGPYKPDLTLCDDIPGSITDYTTWYGRLIRAQFPVMPLMWVTEAADGDANQPVDVRNVVCFEKKASGLYNVRDYFMFGAGVWGSKWSVEQVLELARHYVP